MKEVQLYRTYFRKVKRKIDSPPFIPPLLFSAFTISRAFPFAWLRWGRSAWPKKLARSPVYVPHRETTNKSGSWAAPGSSLFDKAF